MRRPDKTARRPPRKTTPTARWGVTLFYQSAGDYLLREVHQIVELADLHDIVERGPHWDTIFRIEIERLNLAKPLTMQEAEKL